MYYIYHIFVSLGLFGLLKKVPIILEFVKKASLSEVCKECSFGLNLVYSVFVGLKKQRLKKKCTVKSEKKLLIRMRECCVFLRPNGIH